MKSKTLIIVLGAAAFIASAQPPAQVPAGGQPAGRAGQGRGGFGAQQGPAPAYANMDYAPPEPATSNGHKLDLYIPSGASQPLPVVIWTGGSAPRC